jgi:hypothetical protein
MIVEQVIPTKRGSYVFGNGNDNLKKMEYSCYESHTQI